MELGKYRRGVVRPLTGEAEDMLRRGRDPGTGAVEAYRFEEVFYEKYFALFNDLDRICGVGGDDFEVEEIEIDRLPCVLRTLKTYNRRDTKGKLDGDLDELLDRFWGLCFRADKDGRSVFLCL